MILGQYDGRTLVRRYGGGGFGGYDSGDGVRRIWRRRFRRRRRFQRLVETMEDSQQLRTNSSRSCKSTRRQSGVRGALRLGAVPEGQDSLSDFNILCVS